MTYLSKLTEVLLFAAILCGTGARNRTFAAAPAQGNPATAPHAASGLAAYWVSATTHNVYRVQIKGNTLTANWVNVSGSEAQHGAYIRSTCHRAGKQWVGATQSFLRCEIENAQGKPYSHWCHILTRIQISDVSADRITGRAEALKRFDCRQCAVLAKEWKSFTWFPARAK